MMTYNTILIDPPWSFKTWSDNGTDRSPDYPTMTLDELAALPMHRLMADDCAMFMWATWPTLPDALRLGESWGLDYKTCAFVWIKRTTTGKHWHTGLGYWTRANTEPCLLFTRGKPKRKSKGVHQLLIDDDSQMELFPEPLVARVMAHSTKPVQQYEKIEQLVNGSYLEVFARSTRAGWDSIGNAIDGLDIRDVLNG